MKNLNQDILLRIAQGDAYCIALEFISRHHEHDDIMGLKRFHSHPIYKKKPGLYTDDTQMSIAVSEVLINGRNMDDPRTWAQSFVDVFHRDPRDAYSRGFQSILEKSKSASQLISACDGYADTNGAAMRSVPLGVIPDIKRMLSIASTQATVTHHSNGGILSSRCVALMSHFALHTDRPFTELQDFLEEHVSELKQIRPTWEGRVAGREGLGMKTVHAVNTLLRTKSTLREVILQTLEWGGDTDSVAAIAMGIASCRMEDDLPEFFETQLETNGKYGVEFLKELGSRLMKIYDQKLGSLLVKTNF